MGNRGASSGKSGGGATGRATITEKERAAIVNDVEKDVKSMKAPTLQHSSILKTNGLDLVVTKQSPYGGGKSFLM